MNYSFKNIIFVKKKLFSVPHHVQVTNYIYFFNSIIFNGDIMANLDKSIEEEILAIVEKYQKDDTKLLNYLITDDEITFFSPLANGKAITAEDLQKVADILKGSFIGMEMVNQEYRFKFKMGL